MASSKLTMRKTPGSPKVSDLIGFFEGMAKAKQKKKPRTPSPVKKLKEVKKEASSTVTWFADVDPVSEVKQEAVAWDATVDKLPEVKQEAVARVASVDKLPEVKQEAVARVASVDKLPEEKKEESTVTWVANVDKFEKDLYDINYDYYKLDEVQPETEEIEKRPGNITEARQKALESLQNYENIFRGSKAADIEYNRIQSNACENCSFDDDSFEFVCHATDEVKPRNSDRTKPIDIQKDRDGRTDSSYFSNDEDEFEDGNTNSCTGLNSAYELDESYSVLKSPTSASVPIYENITIKFNFMEGERIVELQKHNEDCEAEVLLRGKSDLDGLNERAVRITRCKKDYIIEELIKTEASYIRNLKHIATNYIEFIQQTDIADYKTIFGNVENICRETEVFYEQLKQCGDDHEEIGRTFLRNKNLFNRYPAYCKNKKRSQRLVMGAYKEIIQLREILINDPLGLSSYLLAPIQRLAKYELLLKTLFKNLNYENYDTKDLQSAILLIQRISRTSNDIIILDSIEHNPFSVTNTGEFIDKDNFKMLSPKKLDVILFMFQKVILFTIQNEKNTDNFVYKTYIPVDSLSRKSEAGSVIFTLEDFYRRKKHKDPEIILEARSQEAKNKWIKQIDELLWKQLLKYKDEVTQSYNPVPTNSDMNEDTEEASDSFSDNSSTLNVLK